MRGKEEGRGEDTGVIKIVDDPVEVGEICIWMMIVMGRVPSTLTLKWKFGPYHFRELNPAFMLHI